MMESPSSFTERWRSPLLSPKALVCSTGASPHPSMKSFIKQFTLPGRVCSTREHSHRYDLTTSFELYIWRQSMLTAMSKLHLLRLYIDTETC